MDDTTVTNVLNAFASCARAFALEEPLGFADSHNDRMALTRAILADPRFVRLAGTDTDDEHLVSKECLLQWFCRLSLRLAEAKQARLDKCQVAAQMSSLRMNGRWHMPPAQGVRFGRDFGFIGSAVTDGQYAFPVAHTLSFMEFRADVIEYVIENIPAQGNADSISRSLAEQLVEQVFSQLNWKTRHVVRARTGLMEGGRMTLQQIANSLGGYTREWIRQLEAGFWDRVQARPRGRSLARRASTALACLVISRKGSLITDENCAETPLLRFLARCACVPVFEFPQTGVIVIGLGPEDIMQVDSMRLYDSEIETDSIAELLDSQGQFCLIGDDTRALADSIAGFWRKRLL